MQPVRRADEDGESRRREFERLAQSYQREIYNAALRMTGDREDAEDLAQDVFVRAFTRFHQFTPGTNFRAWLFRILATTYINQFRRQERMPDRVGWDDLTPEAEHWLSQEHGSAEDAPEASLLTTVTDEEVQGALAALPEEFRTVVVLSDLSELSYKEISEALRIPIGTVRSRLSRGRRLLRRKLLRYARERRLI